MGAVTQSTCVLMYDTLQSPRLQEMKKPFFDKASKSQKGLPIKKKKKSSGVYM